MKSNKYSRITGALGLALILIGILCNEWLLSYLFSPDGQLLASTRLIIAIFDAFNIVLGFWLWKYRNPRILAKLALCFVAILMALFLIEVFLRYRNSTLFIKNPKGTGSYRMAPNRELGGVKTNSHGMRWREVSRDNRSGTKRVAFLGDSFTFGCCTDSLEQTFVGVFDSRMRKMQMEVLNFGVGGYDLADIHLQLVEEALTFHPDIAVLVFFNGNDFSGTYLSMKEEKIPGIERFEYESPRIPEAFRASKHRQFDFLLDLALFHLYSRSRNQWKPDNPVSGEVSFPFTSEFMRSEFWSSTPYPPIAIEARDVSLGVLSKIHDVCQGNGTRLMIVALPFHAQVYSRFVSSKNHDIRYPQKYVEEFASGRSIPYLDTLPAFREFVEKNHQPLFLGDGHYNNQGHRLVGDLLVNFFNRRAAEYTEKSQKEEVALKTRIKRN